MRIRLTADSACDLSPDLAEQCGAQVIPLSIIQDGREMKDGVDVHPQDIFDCVAGGGALPKTAAVNMMEYQEAFERLLEDCDAIIHISLGSGFSSCHQNARLAAEGLPVYCVDSQNLSTGSGFLIVLAADLIAQGELSAEEIAAYLRSLTPKAEASFIVDKLEFLHKGGRCSALAVMGANVLKLRPCIEVRDGAMTVGKKYRGSLEKCVLQYVEDRLKGRDDIRHDLITLTSIGCDEALLAKVRAAIEAYGPFERIVETACGCTISSHCGPGTLGMLVLKK